MNFFPILSRLATASCDPCSHSRMSICLSWQDPHPHPTPFQWKTWFLGSSSNLHNFLKNKIQFFSPQFFSPPFYFHFCFFAFLEIYTPSSVLNFFKAEIFFACIFPPAMSEATQCYEALSFSNFWQLYAAEVCCVQKQVDIYRKEKCATFSVYFQLAKWQHLYVFGLCNVALETCRNPEAFTSQVFFVRNSLLCGSWFVQLT